MKLLKAAPDSARGSLQMHDALTEPPLSWDLEQVP